MPEKMRAATGPDGDLLAELRRRMEAERIELLEQASRLEADFADESWKEPRSDDDAETGSATFERERTMSLARNARQVIAEIDRALERMDAGTYGLCTSCHQPIAAERLDAVPQTLHCFDCRRKMERRR